MYAGTRDLMSVRDILSLALTHMYGGFQMLCSKIDALLRSLLSL